MGGRIEKPSELGTGSCFADRCDAAALTSPAQRPQIFNFDAQGIRVVGDEITPWFVATDICRALGLTNASESVRSLEEDEKGLRITETLGGPQELVTVNESGLYALIFRSRKPEARLFRRWVTAEVLPAIRKSGTYTVPALPARTLALGSPPPVQPGPALAAHPVPTIVDDVGQLLAAVCGSRASRTVRGRELAEAAYKLGLWPHQVTDPTYSRQIAVLCRHLVNYVGHWIPLPGTPARFIGFTTIGRNRHRRYKITRWVQEGRP